MKRDPRLLAPDPAAPPPADTPSTARHDLLLLIASRVFTRLGDGFLRILSVLLVAAKSDSAMTAGLVLVFRYACELLINAISGPFIDKLRIRSSLMASDLIRTGLAALLIVAVLSGQSYVLYLILAFLGDFVFMFFKPAADKVVKVSFPTREGTKVLSQVDAANHMSNIGGYMLASFLGTRIGLSSAVLLGPAFFFLSFLLVTRLRLPGESVIDYAKDRKKSFWVRQREGFRYTWASPPLRLLLIGRSLVAVARGAFSVLAVVYLANLAKGLSAYGYFESTQSAGKVLVTALVIPLFFAYRSTFLLTALSELAIALSFFGLNMVNEVTLACIVGVLVGAGQAAEAVGIDAIVNRFAEAHIQGRAKATTSFGSRLSGLAAIGLMYLLVNRFGVDARSLFAYLGIFPILGACVFFLGWLSERGTLARLEFVADHDSVGRLTIVAGPSQSRTIALQAKALMLGRSHRNDIVLDDDAASRFHAVVRPERGEYVIEDLHSANGVLVDGVLLEKAVLKPGSRITLGCTELVFDRGPEEDSAEPKKR